MSGPETPPDSTNAPEVSQMVSQDDGIKSEPGTQDIAMNDAPTPPATEKATVKLEELFDDEDSDDEFPSSAPVAALEDDLSQPAPVYGYLSYHEEGQC